MSWKERMKEFGGGDMAFLSEDGEAIKFIVVGEPVLLEGEFKGTPSRKVGCPVITEDGFLLFVVGMRLARKLSKHETDFPSRAFMAVRHGEANDSNATYELKVLDDEQLVKKLFEIQNQTDLATAIPESIAAAKEVMSK